MSQDRHQRIAEVFGAACELEPAEREAYVTRVCEDEALRGEVLELLAYDDSRAHPGLSSSDEQRGHLIQKALLEAGSTEDEARPARIGPYELQEQIGEGGMGRVYAADQLEPVQRRVALKLIKTGMDSAQVVARFEAERQTLAMMSHPNIAQVFDGGATDEGRPFFVMELVAGDPITDHCDRHGLSTRSRIELFLGVCGGVQHAHQKGIIHRDLKPSNVLVTEYDGRPVPKIIDFGVARATTGDLAGRTLHTMVGQMVGTLDYMSPEQADPTRMDVDTRSDVYSLGVLLYQLLSGLLPFEHSSVVDVPLSEVRRTIRELDPPTPSTRLRRQTDTAAEVATRRGTDERSLIRQLAGDLDWITLKALEKDPARRYQSASELADDLRRYLADEPVLAGRPGALYRTRKWVRRHRVGVIAGVMVVVALGAGIFGIVSGRIAAEARATELLRLSDGYRLRQIEQDAERLWPPHPKQIDGLIEFRDRVARMIDGLADHRATLTGRAWNAESTEDEWQHGLLSELIEGLERIQAGLLDVAEPTTTYGWNIAKRLEVARDLDARFSGGEDVARAWDQAQPHIREAYPGLSLTPQMGLLPLGPDPDSGLWEFAHLLTGEPAQRDPRTGGVVMAEETGLVLVLLPGGTFWMGAQCDDPGGQNYDENLAGYRFDAMAEGPVHEATVEPFFLSKFEMTVAQWNRFVGRKPNPDRQSRGKSRQTNPVASMTLAECERIARRLGLTLPTEEQWEYAARAGTNAPWWSGQLEKSLEGVANLYDTSLLQQSPGLARLIGADPVLWDDQYPMKAPVGSLAANGFGLHDVHGNIGEFCSLHRLSYSLPRKPEKIPDFGASRGGSYVSGSYSARCSFRSANQGADFSHHAAGLRPARPIDP